MTKTDNLIIGSITKKSAYIEVIKLIFHSKNNKGKHLFKPLLDIYSKFSNYNLTTYQNTIINLISSMMLMLTDNSINQEEKRNLLINLVVNTNSTTDSIIENIEEIVKDVEFHDIDEIISNVSQLVEYVELISLLADNYSIIEDVINKNVISYPNVLDSLKKIYSIISNTITKYDKTIKDDSIFDLSNMSDEINKLKIESSSIYTLNTDIDIFNTYKLLTSSRLTLFASPTNHGKTTIISSIISECAKRLYNQQNEYKSIASIKKKDDVVLCFVSLEESEVDIKRRILSNLLDIEKEKIEFMDELEIASKSKRLKKHDNCNNIKIFIKYFPAGTKVVDIELLIQQLNEKGTPPILVVIDYMDKLSSNLINSDIYRLQLTSVSYELRNIALNNNIPIITATQLNRDSINRPKLDVDLLAESYGKSWEADTVVVFRQKQQYQETYIELSIPKTRHTSRLSDAIMIPVDYSKNKLINRIIEKDKTNKVENNSSYNNVYTDNYDFSVNTPNFTGFTEKKPEHPPKFLNNIFSGIL